MAGELGINGGRGLSWHRLRGRRGQPGVVSDGIGAGCQPHHELAIDVLVRDFGAHLAAVHDDHTIAHRQYLRQFG